VAKVAQWWRLVTGGLAPDTRELLAAIPGVKSGPVTISCPANACGIVQRIVETAGVSGRWIAPRIAAPRTAALARPYLREFVPAFLTPYQREGIAASLTWPDESGLFTWSGGAGKTLGSIIWALADGARPILAVTKPAVRGQWAREVERFTNVPAIVLESTEPTLPPLPPPPYFLVTGYATLPYWVDELERLRPRSLILDECHLVQSSKRWDPQIELQDSPPPGELVLIEGGADTLADAPAPPVKVNFALKDNIAAAAYRLSRVAKRRLGTTATPIRDRVRNLWAQLDLVRPWEFGGFYPFCRRYCAAAENPFGGIDTRGFSNLDELKERLSFICHKVPFSVANRDLPPKRRQVTYIKVSDQVRAEGIAAELRQAVRHGPTALLEMRLMEAAARKRKIVTEYVADAVSAGQKVIVFTGRRRDVDALEKSIRWRVGIGPLVLAGHGGVPLGDARDPAPGTREGIVAAYMASAGPAVLIGTGDAFGEGLNLQDTDLLIQAMLPYTPAQIIQREARVARLGQTRAVLILYLICEGTVDEHVAAILLHKLPAIEQALDQDEVRGLGRELVGASEEELLASLLEKVIGPGEKE
jgi:hypothetical protein